MAKRFTETTKWEDPWYRKLTPLEKSFWGYICDKCDNAGIWKVDYEMASFCIGEEVDKNIVEAINKGKKRLVFFDNENFLVILDFISFQIGDLHQSKLTNLQKNCISLLHNYRREKGLDAVAYGLITRKLPVSYSKLTDIGKSKGKDNIKEGGCGGKQLSTKNTFGEFVKLTADEHKKLTETVGPVRRDEYIEKLNHHIGSKGTKYKSHYHTILVWLDKDGKKPSVREKAVQKSRENEDASREKSKREEAALESAWNALPEEQRQKVMKQCEDAVPDKTLGRKMLVLVKRNEWIRKNCKIPGGKA